MTYQDLLGALEKMTPKQREQDVAIELHSWEEIFWIDSLRVCDDGQSLVDIGQIVLFVS
ncbi:hypothetical protein LCGC14_2844090 [marine sediment metagenome]|uniref:Uncharacterized protein n=1 Tax=marine sediment metagenome TaxID=412755 RepID=A0A0F9AIX5_9ZZZZ